MQHGAGIEQRRALIGVFLTEIGSDQSASRIVAAIGAVEVIGDLVKTPPQHRVDVAVVLIQGRGDALQLTGQLRLAERQDQIDRFLSAGRASVETSRIAGLKRPERVRDGSGRSVT
jgi:hypothetical protein